MNRAPTTEELGKESYKSHHFEQPTDPEYIKLTMDKPEQCKHNWAKKGNGKVCIECGKQPNTELKEKTQSNTRKLVK